MAWNQLSSRRGRHMLFRVCRPRRSAGASHRLTMALSFALAACETRAPLETAKSSSAQTLAPTTAPEGWDQHQLDVPTSDGITPLQYGGSLALSGDLALVGAMGSLEGETPVGVVYPFKHRVAGWQPLDVLHSPEVADGQVFGAALAASSKWVAITRGDAGGAAGNVWVYPRTADGLGEPSQIQWKEPLADGSRFGAALAIDDTSLLVSDPTFPGDTELEGAVYAFTYDEQSASWQSGELIRPTGSNVHAALFGLAIALQDDTLLVGASNEGDTNGGAAYVFHRKAGSWLDQPQRLVATTTGAVGFGQSVAIASSRLYVSAPAENDAKGAVDPFELNPGV